jgi:ArsR family transcriptional regulator, zinc-responsive transcriptional repressor
MKNMSCNCVSCGPSCTCTVCRCKAYANMFETLGNPNRMLILSVLRKGECNVTSITKETKLEQTAVSHALRKLEEQRLVRAKRDGKYRVYSINKKTTEQLLGVIDRHLEAS